jgi:hypothetical protein
VAQFLVWAGHAAESGLARSYLIHIPVSGLAGLFISDDATMRIEVHADVPKVAFGSDPGHARA